VLHGTTIGAPVSGLVSGLYEVNLPPGLPQALALAAYKADPWVMFAQADVDVVTQTVPNDPLFANQNNLLNTGQNGGTPGDDINATAAWKVTTGSNNVVVAEMDTGIDYTHPDLYQNVWINQAEIPKSRLANLVDVDHDGLITFADLNNPINQGPGKIMPRPGNTTGTITAADLLAPMQLDVNGTDTGWGGWANPNNVQDGDTAHPDDLVGWNFINNTNNPFDDNGHGTEVAGVLGAQGNNDTGVAGVEWTTQIMPVKFLNSVGGGSISTFIQALNYSVQHGAKIANNSWGGAGNDPALKAAIQSAANAGQIFVVAAGNNAANLDTTQVYPASFNVNNIVSVASIDRVDALASYSNYGPHTVSIAAPGENLWTTEPGGKYSTSSGTSMATPEVSAALALVWGLHPSWTYSQVIAQVLGTATTQGTYVQGKVISGVLNVGAAVGTPVIPVTPPTSTPPTPTPTPPSSAGFTFTSSAPKNLEYYGSAISSIPVNLDQAVTSLTVTINVAHNRDSDLFIHLEGPGGIQVLLSNRRGLNGANFEATTFDDNASTPIGQGAAPFSGTFKPEWPLAAFKGENATGLWRLWVDDQVGNGNGAIQSWSLTFNAAT
jgi:subtilisin family serine protease